jgi:glycogen debranching enzyme
MSAGHPHFTTGWARVWGRDCFISLNGVLLANNLIDEAREVILEFASCARHGLMPNLLDSGRNPRYNNRDACWWFMKALKEYLY